MMTPDQQNNIFRLTVPRIEEDLVVRGLRRDQANVLAIEIVLAYIVEAQDDPSPTLPTHSYGIKIGPGKGFINLFLTFESNPPTP